MKKIKLQLEVELDKSDVGFMIVPTGSKEVLKGKYSVSKKDRLHPWQCTNGVTLKEPIMSAPKKKKST